MIWIAIMWLLLIAVSCWPRWQMPLCFVCCVSDLSGTCRPCRVLSTRAKSETGMTLQLLQPLRSALPTPGQHRVTEHTPKNQNRETDSSLSIQQDFPQYSCRNQTNLLIDLCGTNPFQQRWPKPGPVGEIWLVTQNPLRSNMIFYSKLNHIWAVWHHLLIK